jgi:hypothetical protein|tara:strand:+ start:73 stop:1794 length:1722 start_codon:yes stop_codon:yes gene_type:complete
MFVKYANVVEFVRNARIKIYHTGQRNCVVYDGRDTGASDNSGKHLYKIYSATPNVKGIEKFVGIIHELSHVLFESPFKATKSLLQGYWHLKEERYQLMFNVFNVLEDQRIESHMGKMYLKHKGRFDKTTKKLGKLMDMDKLMMDNPINMLLAIRFQRGDDIKHLKNYDVYEKALKDVVFTDKYGALRVLVSIRPYIDEWIEEKESKMYSAQRNLNDKEKSLLQKDTVKTTTDFNENKIENSSPSHDAAKIPQDIQESDDDYRDRKYNSPNIQKPDVDKILEDGKELGKDVVDDIFSKLRNDGTIVKLPKNVKIVKRLTEVVTIDQTLVKGLSKLFKILKMRQKEYIDKTGDDIDIESYVEGVIRGSNMGNCRINSKRSHGLSIVVSIDGSSSMYGGKIVNARNMVANMFESVKDLDNVDIRANVWSGSSNGSVGITEINNKSDLERIGISVVGGGYYSTPIHMGIEWSGKMLKEMKGNKKMMIVITDGIPNHFTAGYHIPMESYLKSCRKSMIKTRNITKNILCMVVEDKNSYKYNPVRRLFKPSQTMNVSNMNKASERIIKEFKQMVMKSLV